MRIANANARTEVVGRREFQASNIFGVNQGGLYTVYSYGLHWPMFIYDSETGRWFENEDKYSVTTSKHRTQAHPQRETTLLSCHAMQDIVAKRSYLKWVLLRGGDA